MQLNKFYWCKKTLGKLLKYMHTHHTHSYQRRSQLCGYEMWQELRWQQKYDKSNKNRN